jgi:glycosyltransferase involved in cell wall biosynthesis
MQILVLVNKVPYPPRDGGSIATLSLAKQFVKKGHNVSILAMNTHKHYIDPKKIPSEISKNIPITTVDTPAKITMYGAFKNLIFTKKAYTTERFFTEEFRSSLIEILKAKKYDIIQLEGSYMGIYIDTIRAHSKAIISMRAHNLEYEIWERSAFNAGLLHKFYFKILANRIKQFEINQLNQFDAIIPITNRDGKKLTDMGCKIPMHTAPMGVTINGKPDFSKVDYPSLFHIGALDWPPNQEGMLWFFESVWPHILKRHPNVQFYLAGRNPSSKIKNLKIKNLHYLGEVESATEFIAGKAIGIVPLLSGSGMRIKIVEAMAMGKPQVTTSIGAEGNPAKDQEEIMIADNPKEFAEKVCMLIEDKVLFDRISKNAYEFAIREFDYDKITTSLIDFYNSL